MSKVNTLRVLVNQRLTAAAEEIFGLFERVMAEYEEELNQRRELMDSSPRNKVTQMPLVSEEEVPPEQQGRSFSLQQDQPPEVSRVKEEEEDNMEFSALPASSEGGEKPESSQLCCVEEVKTEADGEDGGGPEPASGLQPDTRHMASHCSASETRRPHTDSTTGPTPISSSQCVESFGRIGNQQKHRVKPFRCTICGKTYKQKNNLTTHVRLHTEGKCFSCSVCDRKFQFRAHLAVHNRSHAADKPFRCSVCGKTFAQRVHLTTHFRVHTGEKPFTCSVCEVSFNVKTNLIAHMRKHTGERPFGCSVCGKTFTQKINLSRHSAVHADKSIKCLT